MDNKNLRRHHFARASKVIDLGENINAEKEKDDKEESGGDKV